MIFFVVDIKKITIGLLFYIFLFIFDKIDMRAEMIIIKKNFMKKERD